MSESSCPRQAFIRAVNSHNTQRREAINSGELLSPGELIADRMRALQLFSSLNKHGLLDGILASVEDLDLYRLDFGAQREPLDIKAWFMGGLHDSNTARSIFDPELTIEQVE